MDIGIAIFKNELLKPFKHGYSGYANHWCRCNICKDGVKEYSNNPERKAARKLWQSKYESKRYSTPERKEYMRVLRCTPKVMAYNIAYRKKYKDTPHGKEKLFSCQLKHKYGITSDKYREMMTIQNGVCAICGGVNANGKKLAVDHCHETGKIRQLLCETCNYGLGQFKDNQNLLIKAAEYLRKHS